MNAPSHDPTTANSSVRWTVTPRDDPRDVQLDVTVMVPTGAPPELEDWARCNEKWTRNGTTARAERTIKESYNHQLSTKTGESAPSLVSAVETALRSHHNDHHHGDDKIVQDLGGSRFSLAEAPNIVWPEENDTPAIKLPAADTTGGSGPRVRQDIDATDRELGVSKREARETWHGWGCASVEEGRQVAKSHGEAQRYLGC